MGDGTCHWEKPCPESGGRPIVDDHQESHRLRNPWNRRRDSDANRN